MLDLEAIVQCIPKPMRPMAQAKEAEREDDQSRQGMAEQCQCTLIAWRFEPSQWKGEAEQEEQHWDQQGGKRPSCAE
jgi:hypothetical protein